MNISRDAQDCRVADSACGKRMATGQIVCGSNCRVVATKALVVENRMKTAIFGNRNEECSNASFEEVDGAQLHINKSERFSGFLQSNACRNRALTEVFDYK